MFYLYRQNNSWGRFDKDQNVNEYVVVESGDFESANTRAESLGLYFDGKGDCSHCGDRWSSQLSERMAKKTISVPSKEHSQPDCIIHYADGRKFYCKIENVGGIY